MLCRMDLAMEYWYRCQSTLLRTRSSHFLSIADPSASGWAEGTAMSPSRCVAVPVRGWLAVQVRGHGSVFAAL